MHILKAKSQTKQRDRFNGVIEMDETHISGKLSKLVSYGDYYNPKRGSRMNKALVINAIERDMHVIRHNHIINWQFFSSMVRLATTK